MRFIRCLLLVCCLCLCLASCSSSPGMTQSPASMPAINLVANVNTPIPVPVLTPLSEAASILIRLPKCEGIQTLQEPIKFKWPNIERHLKEYQDGSWGYFSCEQPQADVAALYRVQMPKPPSNAYEMNWVEIQEGAVGVFYNGSTWTIVWIVPQPGNAQKSYVIVAQTSFPVDEVCRLDQVTLSKHLTATGSRSIE